LAGIISIPLLITLVIGNTNHLELGQEVEYSLSPTRNPTINNGGGNCIPAENVRLLPRGE